MCGSVADIQSVTAEIRRGKRKEEEEHRVTGQLADTPTRGLQTRGLDISRTGQLAD